MNFHRAVEMLGFRQKSYQQAFSGSSMHLVLVDLAKYSNAFNTELEHLTSDQLREMNGRRQIFFRILNHLKLSPSDLEQVYQPAIIHAARRIQTTGENDE